MPKDIRIRYLKLDHIPRQRPRYLTQKALAPVYSIQVLPPGYLPGTKKINPKNWQYRLIDNRLCCINKTGLPPAVATGIALNQLDAEKPSAPKGVLRDIK